MLSVNCFDGKDCEQNPLCGVTCFRLQEERLSKVDQKETGINSLIDSIYVNDANFKHIANTGKINGTLRGEIKRVMECYAEEQTQEIRKQKYNLEKRLDEISKPAILEDYQKNA